MINPFVAMFKNALTGVYHTIVYSAAGTVGKTLALNYNKTREYYNF